MNKPGGHVVFKATFEAVGHMQQQLRRHIESLTEENRPLKDETEKTLFHNEINHALLGLGTFKMFTIKIDKMYTSGNVEFFARWLASRTSNSICIPGEEGAMDSPPVDISLLWSRLLDLLFSVFPHALEKSIGMSKESELSSRKDSFNVGGKNGSG